MKEFNVTQRILNNKSILDELESKFKNKNLKKYADTAIIGDNDEVDFEKLAKEITTNNFNPKPWQEAIINTVGRPVI